MAAGTTSKLLFDGTTQTSESYTSSYQSCLVALFFSDTFADGAITFEASPDGGTTWYPVYTSDGAEVSITAVHSTCVAIDPSQMAWAGLVRLVSSVDQTDETVIASWQRVI